jgi:hypothetical protein
LDEELLEELDEIEDLELKRELLELGVLDEYFIENNIY